MNKRTFGPLVVIAGGLAYAVFIGLGVGELRYLVANGPGGHELRAAAYGIAFLLLAVASLAFWSGFRSEGRTAHELEVRTAAERETLARREDRRRAVLALMEPGGMRMVFQPIIAIGSGRVEGFEALARFACGGPETWFPEADRVGLLTELELHAISLGLTEGLAKARPDQYISVNLSAATLLDPALLGVIGPDVGPRVVVELTEHTPVEVYAEVIAALAVLRRRGVRLAIDDFGTGYGSLNHVVLLSADLVKIDRSLVSGIADDSTLSGLVAAIVAFTATMGIPLLAEGVETSAEATCLRDLGVGLAQGWFFGRPGDLPAQAPRPELVQPRSLVQPRTGGSVTATTRSRIPPNATARATYAI